MSIYCPMQCVAVLIKKHSVCNTVYRIFSQTVLSHNVHIILMSTYWNSKCICVFESKESHSKTSQNRDNTTRDNTRQVLLTRYYNYIQQELLNTTEILLNHKFPHPHCLSHFPLHYKHHRQQRVSISLCDERHMGNVSCLVFWSNTLQRL